MNRLEKLEYLESSFILGEFFRALRHHGATGEWPTDVPRTALESAKRLPRSETGVSPRLEDGRLLCEKCLDAGRFTLVSQPDNGSYNLCDICGEAPSSKDGQIERLVTCKS